MLQALQSIICRPFTTARHNRDTRTQAQASLQDVTIPTREDEMCETGKYCIRATVYDVCGASLYKTYEGFSTDINIGNQTEMACERRRLNGHKCTKPKITMMGDVGYCNEHIIIKNMDGTFQIIN